jgi:hypothetical protein
MGFPVIWKGRYYSDAERCSHCNRPRPNRRRRWNPKTKKHEEVTTLCRECQRRHASGDGYGGIARGRFDYNGNCPACRDTGMVESVVHCGTNHFD